MISTIERVIDLWEADLTVGEIREKIAISEVDLFCILSVGLPCEMPVEMIERGLGNIQEWMTASDATLIFKRDAGCQI